MNRLVFLNLFLIFFCHQALANKKLAGVCLGAIVGDPTGVSLKFNLNTVESIDAVLAWSSVGAHVHSNFLWQQNGFFNTKSNSFDLFYGVGARLVAVDSGSNKNKTTFGPRAPIGINYRIQQSQVNVFFELALNLNLIPNTDVDLDGGLGIRYHF